MFRTLGPQGSLFELLIPAGMRVLSGELAEIDELLADERFFRPFRECFDPSEGRPSIPIEKEGSEVPLSPSSASSVLGEFLRSKGADATLDFQQVRDLIDSPSVPVEVRAAAKYLRENPEVWTGVVGFGYNNATATKFDEFIVTNRNLATVAGMYDRLDTAKQDSGKKGGTGDGKVTDADIDAALQNKAGKFTADEVKALKWALEHENELGFDLRSGASWTRALVHRQVFAENPKLAAVYVRMASKNPDRFMYGETWFDTAGTRAWLNTATAATTDPEQRDKCVLEFVSVYQETKPPGNLAIAHELLDWISYGDPTQAADGLNTAIYAAEGDRMNASPSAAGILLPLAGGGALRLSKKAITRLAIDEADEVGGAVIKAVVDGTLNDEVMKAAVKEAREKFGDETARILQKNFDEAVQKAEKQAKKEVGPPATLPAHGSGAVRPREPLTNLPRDESGNIVGGVGGGRGKALSDAEANAVREFEAGGSPDPSLLNSAKNKLKGQEKYQGSRNKQKRGK